MAAVWTAAKRYSAGHSARSTGSSAMGFRRKWWQGEPQRVRRELLAVPLTGVWPPRCKPPQAPADDGSSREAQAPVQPTTPDRLLAERTGIAPGTSSLELRRSTCGVSLGRGY